MIIFILVLLRDESNQQNNEKTKNYFEDGDRNNNKKYLKEGFICSNFSDCYEYFKNRECVSLSTMWFCIQPRIFVSFIIKHSTSFMFLILGIILRVYYHSTNQIPEFLLLYIRVFLFDIIIAILFDRLLCSNYTEEECITLFFAMVLLNTSYCVFVLGIFCYELMNNVPIFEFKSLSYGKYSYPISLKLIIILYNISMIMGVLSNLLIIIDFFKFISSKNYRRKWIKYISELEKRKYKNNSEIIRKIKKLLEIFDYFTVKQKIL